MATEAERPPNFQEQGEQLGLGLTEPAVMTRFGKALFAGLQELLVWVVEFTLKNVGRFVVFLATAMARGEDKADPVFRQLTDAALNDLVGADAKAGHAAVGRQMLDAMTGGAGAAPNGALEPSMRGAEAYMETVMKLALEGYLEGSLFHALSAGFLEKFGELDDILAKVLGVERSTRAVMRPILSAKVVTPTTWHVNKVFRPQLLAAAEAVRQVQRGRWSLEKGREELARHGYSDERIEALMNAQRKFFSAGDVRQFVDRDHWTRDQGIQHLRDQGYDEGTALDALRLEGLRTIESLEQQEAGAIVGAYVNGTIGHGEMRALLAEAVQSPTDRALFEELADVRFGVTVKHLTPAEARRLVKVGILSMVDYRAALRRDRYVEEAVLALELELREELRADRELEERRAAADAAKQALLEERRAEQERRRLELEQQRALARRGDEADLEAAAIRGLIPIARVAELYRARYDADTVAILVELLEDKRQDYLDAERRRADALRRAAQRDISVADVEEAVLANILTFEQYRARLEHWNFAAADVELLVATLRARKAAADAAKKQRDDAGAAAQKRGIDLGRFERLVRRGARSIADYAALLRSLDFDDAAIAAMRELLALEIADDRKADQARQNAEAKLRARGLSLEQLRRLVVLGLAPRATFEQLLVQEGFTADAQILLLRELDAAVADAEDARRRRDEAARGVDGAALPVSSVRRAARLGLVSVDTYLDRLVAAGYSADDLEIELALLLAEIADVQAARAARDQAPPPEAPKGLTLAELARAVRAGLQPLETFRARAVELGLAKEAVDTQVRILGDELRETELAKRRRDEIGVALEGKGTPLAELEAAVMAGALTVVAFVEQLELHGLTRADAELLGSLLVDALEGAVR